MTQDEIKRLAERIASGESNDVEIQLYNQLFNSFQLSEIAQQDVYGNKEELEELIKRAIWEKTGLQTPIVRLVWFRWAAAAVIFLLASASIWLLQNRTPKSEVAKITTQQKRFKNDVAPGQDGAILTLSNGKTIVLDNAHNGSLAQQGATEVIKMNGQIVYENQGKTSEVVYNTMTTPKGRQYSLVLADGSKVWLNASSSITFPTVFAGKERKVSITGEAYFEVAHNDQKPFIVQQGEMSVQVLGTHFNVNSYEDESSISVTLLEGSVKVTKGNATSLIKSGQQAKLQKGDIKLVNNVDIDEIMAWKNGLFHFEGTDIGSLMRQLSRWYDLEVVYDKTVNDLFYAEIPRNTKLSDVLKALELTGRVHFSIEGNKVVVMP